MNQRISHVGSNQILVSDGNGQSWLTTVGDHQHPYQNQGAGAIPANHVHTTGYMQVLDNTYWDLVGEKEKEMAMVTTQHYLWQVVVVHTNKEILIDKKVVANDQEDAKFECEVDKILRVKGLKPSDVTIMVTSLGPVKVATPAKEES